MAIDGQELPGARHSAQLDASVVFEPRARAYDQVTHGAGDEDVAGACLAADPGRDVHGDPPDVGVQQFAFAGVDACADSMPNVSASVRNASAQRMACVGPSNVARWPSPVLLTTVPPNRCVMSAVISPKRCSTARHRSSPVAAACCVEATMSVKSTVRRARRDCAGAAWLPVRNSSISVRILSGSVNQARDPCRRPQAIARLGSVLRGTG